MVGVMVGLTHNGSLITYFRLRFDSSAVHDGTIYRSCKEEDMVKWLVLSDYFCLVTISALFHDSWE